MSLLTPLVTRAAMCMFSTQMVLMYRTWKVVLMHLNGGMIRIFRQIHPMFVKKLMTDFHISHNLVRVPDMNKARLKLDVYHLVGI